jgi:hypothetical protein
MLLSFKKYYQMIFFAVLGVGVYLLLKKNPVQGKNMLLHANNMIKYMPIDRSTMDMVSPLFDFTGKNPSHIPFMEEYSDPDGVNHSHFGYRGAPERRILNSGKTGTKRSVSETKKKYVASQQDWKCGHCDQQLNAWFEVDHKIRLEHGGGNDVQNLVALCRECHGKKTALENMG